MQLLRTSTTMQTIKRICNQGFQGVCEQKRYNQIDRRRGNYEQIWRMLVACYTRTRIEPIQFTLHIKTSSTQTPNKTLVSYGMEQNGNCIPRMFSTVLGIFTFQISSEPS